MGLSVWAIVCLGAGAALLVTLSVIDVRRHILPNRLVLAFAVTGIIFHIATSHIYASWSAMIIGALLGGGLLWVVRFLAYIYYVEDAMGLGDVKLLAAAGVWLGVPDIFLAISLGAILGVLHGCILSLMDYIKSRRWPALKDMQIPAGLGFSVGIILTAAWAWGI